MHITHHYRQLLHRVQSLKTFGWAFLMSCLIVALAATLGRATANIASALTYKPDLALYLLLPEEEIRSVELVRENNLGKEYLIETKDGPKLARLRKGREQWYVHEVISLHETE